MLKLLKYEWKACARICLPLYAVELLVAFINRLLYSDIGSKLLYGIPSIVMTMLYAAIMVALFVVTAVVLVQRFYKNLLGSEGYLMFTLPVSVSQHILSKARYVGGTGICVAASQPVCVPVRHSVHA